MNPASKEGIEKNPNSSSFTDVTAWYTLILQYLQCFLQVQFAGPLAATPENKMKKQKGNLSFCDDHKIQLD